MTEKPMRLLKKNIFGWLALAWLGSSPLLAQSSIVTTIAGGGPISFLGNGGPATLANISAPDDIALDSQGNIYIADANYDIVQKVDPITGIISLVAGDETSVPGYIGDGGPATLATFNYPSGLAFDSHDNLYISDYYNNVVRKVDKITGIITTVIGTGAFGFSGDGGPASLATLANPLRLRFDASGNLLIADSDNNAIREVNMTTGILTTIAGTGVAGYSGDGGPATLATLDEPQGMDFDSAGNIYFTDSDNSVVRKINKVTGIITTFAGTGTAGFSGDGGPATLAKFSEEPDGILVGCNNNVYVTDDINNVIRKIDGTTGIITTFAGKVAVSGGVTTGVAGYLDGPALSAEFSHPEAIVFDSQGNMIVDDYMLGYIRKISLACIYTPTPTFTFTNTPTPTFTPTLTPTKTLTPTPTFSPTVTPTNTDSYTPTPTFTFTNTFTPTFSPTPTLSLTPTDSPTVTFTFTSTYSFTPTFSPTSTFTFTSTPTPTWDIKMGKTVSSTSTKSGDTLVYTIGVTVLGNVVNGVVLSDRLPSDVSFKGFGAIGAGSATINSSVSLIQWSLPSPLPPGIYEMTYNTQVDSLVAGGTEIVNGARLDCVGLASSLTSSVTVKVSGNITVRVGVYNEAGELVRQLFLKQFSQPINSITLKDESITRLSGDGGHIDVYHDGVLLGTWDGKNADGDPVSNGVYQVKLDNVDDFGVVTTVTQPAIVNRSLAKVSVSVFNEAGEIVKHLYSLVDDSDGTQMTDVVLNEKVVQPGTMGPQSLVHIQVETSGAPISLAWDGTSDSGAIVTNGQYFLVIRWTGKGGGPESITRSVLVNTAQSPGGEIITAQPNLLRPASGQSRVTFKTSSRQMLTLKAKIYTLAGELVGIFQGTPGTNQTDWEAGSSASGVYLAVVEKLNLDGTVKDRQILKIMVIH